MDENKKLSSEEQRQLMKEQYKQDLRMRKEFLNKVNELKKQQPLVNALDEISKAGEDDTDEWIAKLNQKSAMTEAKMEMALDSTDIPVDIEAPKPELSDAEIRKIQAAEMVAKMKAEMQGGSANPPAAEDAPPATEDSRPARKMLDGLI
jgi:phage shock protein A